MSDADTPDVDNESFDVAKIRAFHDIPLGHFSVIHTKVALGKRLTVFMNRERVKAYLLIDVVDKQCSLDESETLKFIADGKINIDSAGKKAVKNLIHSIREAGGSDDVGAVQVTEGKPPIDGNDAQVTWAVDVGHHGSDDINKVVHDQEADNIDHRQVRKVINVETGDLIVSIVPPTLGISGSDIFGKPIDAKNGRDIAFECGEGVRVNDNRTEFHATETGHVALEERKIMVSPVMRVPTVDFNVGNIEYKGRIEVRGDINDGFTVKAGREISVTGDVKDANLIAANTISAQSFLGRSCVVEAGGGINVARIVNATVHC